MKNHLKTRYRASRVLLFGSGTQALQAAIFASLERQGASGSVALPAFTCYDVASAAAGADASVRLYDVNPSTLEPDYASVESSLRKGAGTLVVTPLFGCPPDWEAVQGLASEYGALLLEDAAQGHGAYWRDRPVGSFGDVSILSFGRGKGWTGGGGGALLVRDRTAVPRVREPDPSAAGSSKDVGSLVRAAVQWALGRPALYAVPRSLPLLELGTTRYRPPSPPAPLPAAAAAILLATREFADREAAIRRRNGRYFDEELSFGDGVRRVSIPDPGKSGFLRYPVRLDGGFDYLEYPRRTRRLGVESSNPSTLGHLPALTSRLKGPVDHVGAAELARDLMTLPTHAWVTAKDRRALVRAVEGDR